LEWNEARLLGITNGVFRNLEALPRLRDAIMGLPFGIVAVFCEWMSRMGAREPFDMGFLARH
jgi:hypothetical protein